MRNSKALKKLRSGQVARTVCAVTPAFMLPKHASDNGYDGIWLESEHNFWNPIDIQNFLINTHFHDIDCIIRPSSIRERIPIGKFLDNGATGLLIPLVNTADQASSIVENAKFPPIGDRGVDGGGLDGDYYTNFNLKDYTEHYNRETLIAVQIESPQAVDNVEEIAEVKGLDVLFVGPSDLSLRLGCPADLKDPRFLEAQKKVADAAEKNGLTWGRPTGGGDDLKGLLDAGARFLNYGGDFGAIVQSFSLWGKEFESALKASGK